MTSAQRKFWRYTVGWFLWPVFLIAAPLYKLYRKVRYNKQTKVKYAEIVKGFSYLVVPDSEVERKAKERAAVCATCRWAKFNGTVNTIIQDNRTVTIKGMVCDHCGCSTSALVRSDKPCPLNKWR